MRNELRESAKEAMGGWFELLLMIVGAFAALAVVLLCGYGIYKLAQAMGIYP